MESIEERTRDVTIRPAESPPQDIGAELESLVQETEKAHQESNAPAASPPAGTELEPSEEPKSAPRLCGEPTCTRLGISIVWPLSGGACM